jgi:RNA polymerase sigma factor (sigma-70 family)
MANLGLRAAHPAHQVGTNAPLLYTSTIPPLEQLLQSWEPDVLRAAKAWGLSYDATQDLAQAALIALAQVLEHDPIRPVGYLRRVITNAMRDEYRAKRLIDNPVKRDGEDEYCSPDVLDSEPVASEAFFDADYVKRWIYTLPPRLQRVFDLLYAQDLTQRSAATRLGLSKTRVVQLNEELLLRGRSELIDLAA